MDIRTPGPRDRRPTPSARPLKNPASEAELEADLSSGGGAYAHLARLASPYLARDLPAQLPMLPHDGLWAADFDGLLVLTSRPATKGEAPRAAAELRCILRRAEAVGGRSPRAVARAGTSPRLSPSPSAADAALQRAHYTSVPRWALSGALPLGVAARILVSDMADVLGDGRNESYEFDAVRIRRRCGLKASTARRAVSELVGLGAARRTGRARYALDWPRLAELAGEPRADEAAARRSLRKGRRLAVPAWAVELCGASESALVLSQAWSARHSDGDGWLWASGKTMAGWLGAHERTLRRARSSLSALGVVERREQWSSPRSLPGGIRLNPTVEIRVSPADLAREIVVRGLASCGGMEGVVEALFSGDDSVAADAARWASRREESLALRRMRRAPGRSPRGSGAAPAARAILGDGSPENSPPPPPSAAP